MRIELIVVVLDKTNAITLFRPASSVAVFLLRKRGRQANAQDTVTVLDEKRIALSSLSASERRVVTRLGKL
jgi:hypothetical protein